MKKTIEGFAIMDVWTRNLVSPLSSDAPGIPGSRVTVSPFIYLDRDAADAAREIVDKRLEGEAKVQRVRATIEFLDD